MQHKFLFYFKISVFQRNKAWRFFLLTPFLLGYSLAFFFFFSVNFLGQLQVYKKLGRRYKNFPYTACHLTCIPSPISNIIPQSHNFSFWIKDGPIHHSHPNVVDYFKVYSWYCIFYGFGQVYNDKYSSLQYVECSHCPSNSLCLAFSFLLPISRATGNHSSFYCLH